MTSEQSGLRHLWERVALTSERIAIIIMKTAIRERVVLEDIFWLFFVLDSGKRDTF